MIRVGIVGYGNLGRGVECVLMNTPDLELAAVFTRRNPDSVKIESDGIPVLPMESARQWANKIDVMVMCGGSYDDLPGMTPQFARDFHVVDSFDNHADVPKHFAAVNQAAEEGGRIAIISAGWDPGLFSVQRLVGSAIIPQGRVYTFWGAGISQGHSQAIRRVSGVLDARQYTIPNAEILQRVRAGENLSPIPQEMHKRRCIVVAEQGADRSTIETEIKTMPNYFAGYDTTVEFVDEQTLLREHGTLPHGGCVICADGGKVIDFHLKVDSNPNFTASVLVTCARAAVRMAERGETGCKTLLDVPPADLSPLSREELYRKFV